jgi:hypothetical protein
MFRRLLFLVSVACVIAFVPLYLFLWYRYPRKYFSEYILTPHWYLGYVLYLLVLIQVGLYGLTQVLRKRWFLAAASFLTGLFILRIMLYLPSSNAHFEYFMYALTFAVGILTIDFLGGRLVSFIDSKEAALGVLLAAAAVTLSVIIASACSPMIEKIVIVCFALAMGVRTTWSQRG